MAIHRAVEAVAANKDGTLTAFTSPCGMCGRPGEVIVPADGFTAWATGRIAVQDAMPDLPGELREQLQTGIDPECWKKHFSPPDDNGADEARAEGEAPDPDAGQPQPLPRPATGDVPPAPSSGRSLRGLLSRRRPPAPGEQGGQRRL